MYVSKWQMAFQMYKKRYLSFTQEKEFSLLGIKFCKIVTEATCMKTSKEFVNSKKKHFSCPQNTCKDTLK